jgi:hypothetical protein
MEEAFNNLYQARPDLEFVCFGDDGTFSVRIGTRIFRFNSDISSADCSYTPALFHLLEQLFPEKARHLARRLTRQCMLAMKIRDCNDRRRCVVLKPRMPVLYSGSTLTTIINTLANFLIAIAISEALAAGQITCPNDIILAVRRAGYVITLQTCEEFEDVQFLKHSPVRDTAGNWKPMLNFGVLMRASGMCFFDLPGRGPLLPRALAFQRGLLQGAYPYANCKLLQSLWKGVGDGPVEVAAKKEFAYKVMHAETYPPYTVDEDSFALRYRLTRVELDYLCELTSNYSVGYSINTTAVGKILMKDYDLSTAEYKRPKFFFGPER